MILINTIITQTLAVMILTYDIITDDPEPYLAIGLPLLWASAPHLYRLIYQGPTTAAFRRSHAIFVTLSALALLTYNDPFYENTIGRFLLDFIWPRDPYDLYTPGSGFTWAYQQFCRRHRHIVADLKLFWRFLVWFGVVAAVVPCLVVAGFWEYNRYLDSAERDAMYQWLETGGEEPQWLVSRREERLRKQQKPEPLLSNRVTKEFA